MSLDVSRLSVLIFDVLGTVVDERGSIRAAVQGTLAEAGEAEERGDALATAWLNRLDELLSEAADGEYRPMDELNREALEHAVKASDVSLGDDALTELAAEGLRPKPWPDAAPGVGALGDRFNVVALSNTTMLALAEITRRGGLRWAFALSSELVGAYKPDPSVYRKALELMRVESGRALMVASHPWDLRAAAEQGMATAYIAREGEDDGEPVGADEFDLQAATIAELAAQLL
ncbi:haloacid dehalogenase type II [Saccharopolyspora aridisoli]|uniref:haloacid dehalogenase type II n=1 Tax=Saccharopolyspora aridisoli TaxID=2530385 RepID=UPI0014053DDF|nr:haloacid dehalogenase type II [Saccharopolyspora aridisoli]